MVQIYNPNVLGKQILIDVENIESDRLKTVENLKPFMDKVVQELNLNVVGECSHQFVKDNVPYGATIVYLLSESHLSIHTFVDEGKITIYLFTCSLSVENEKTKDIIKDYFMVNAFGTGGAKRIITIFKIFFIYYN
jgi:S-adenosylmethionine/arginine decarboxylase-like enzyme